MTNKIMFKAQTPCYINSADTSGNPYRLTPYVSANREIWLAAEGNGCGDDIMLEDITGWMADEINETFSQIDLSLLLLGADEIASCDPDSADWIRDWVDICSLARAFSDKK